ncbi:MAG: hypothetical protein H0U60_04650 [Blastocatellia bacterium]|nr:hypothetical protein [Blastocatellia bacterium]
MAEADRFLFELRELAGLLVKQQGIRQGNWGIYIEFGFGAANVPTGPDGPLGKTIAPASINFVQKIGIQRFPEPNSLTVDAAELHQGKGSKKAASRKAAKKK